MNPDKAKAIPAEWAQMSKIFTALGDEQRQRILLTFGKDEELNVTQLASASALSRPAVSHHLKALRDAGALTSRKQGREVYYRINKGALLETLGHVTAYIQSTV